MQAAGGAAPRLPGAGQKLKAKARLARPQAVNQQAQPAVVSPVVAVVTPATVDAVVQEGVEVVPPANAVVAPAGKRSSCGAGSVPPRLMLFGTVRLGTTVTYATTRSIPWSIVLL